MNDLARRASSFLEAVYNPGLGLFPYSTRVEAGRYVSDYGHPSAIRYSINCLLALRVADEREPGALPFAARADELVADFLARHEARVTNDGDKGLMLVLLAGRDGLDARVAERALARVRQLAEDNSCRALVLQDICWLLWGALALWRAGDERAAPIARDLFRTLVSSFLDRDSLSPRHSLARYRRGTVSFGGIVYFLRVLHEYADFTGDEYAETLFRHAVRRVVAAQGPGGEWPWFFSVRTGSPIDFYPVYGVHQDSMAMLFLLPAYDRGLLGMGDVIERSYAWVLGRNQLGESMILSEPFLRYRSLERTEHLARLRRFARSLHSRHHSMMLEHRANRLRINRECRSYEMGWAIYAWAGRDERLSLVPNTPAVVFSEHANHVQS